MVSHPNPLVALIEDPSSSVVGSITWWWVSWEDEVHFWLWIHTLGVVITPRELKAIRCHDRWHVGGDWWLMWCVGQREGWDVGVRARVGCAGLTG